ncbi:MAG TPA: DUF3280 domain-containing protein [Geminicoccaceae bacterium]|nr:DUF3280 domain-containing protein [Geminicoccaceae bacterium]
MNSALMRGLRGRRSPAALIAAPLLAGLAIAAPPGHAAAAEEPRTVAVFDFELVDTSLQGEIEGARPDELERLRMVGDLLRERLAAAGAYRVVDTAPAAGAIARAGRLRTCGGCELRMAAGLGAELAVIGWVQKVSNLILNVNLTMREVATGRLVGGGSVDVRGNTDESWSRGVAYLVRHRLPSD